MVKEGMYTHTTFIPRRGEIYIVKFDPTVGSEIQKTRPALVIQNNIANWKSPVTIVAAITSYDGGILYPTEVLLQPHDGGLEKSSIVLLNQIRTIDKQRLVKRVGVVAGDIMERVDRALAISVGLVAI